MGGRYIKLVGTLLLMSSLLILYSCSYAKEPVPSEIGVNVGTPPLQETSVMEEGISAISTGEFLLSLIIVLLGISVIFFEIKLLWRSNATPEEIFKILIITLIIIGTLLLITAGYNNNQIAPAVGLFGTIAGYLIGKNSSQKGG